MTKLQSISQNPKDVEKKNYKTYASSVSSDGKSDIKYLPLQVKIYCIQLVYPTQNSKKLCHTFVYNFYSESD